MQGFSRDKYTGSNVNTLHARGRGFNSQPDLLHPIKVSKSKVNYKPTSHQGLQRLPEPCGRFIPTVSCFMKYYSARSDTLQAAQTIPYSTAIPPNAGGCSLGAIKSSEFEFRNLELRNLLHFIFGIAGEQRAE